VELPRRQDGERRAGSGLAALEALLFASPDPVTVESLAEVMECEVAEITEILKRLAERYDRPESGLGLTQVAGGYQIRTREEYSGVVERLLRPERARLSRAALETLAVIAYLQPVTRQEIEDLRGVTVEGVLRGLLQREVIREAGRRDAPGRPIMYATTDRFLEYFGLTDLTDLPPLGAEDLASRVTAGPGGGNPATA